jgi:hypothetical protein
MQIAAIDDEIMAFGFAGDRLANRGIEEIIPLRGAHGRTQISRILEVGHDPDRAGDDEKDDCPQEARSAAAHTTAERRQTGRRGPFRSLDEGPLGVNGVS